MKYHPHGHFLLQIVKKITKERHFNNIEDNNGKNFKYRECQNQA